MAYSPARRRAGKRHRGTFRCGSARAVPGHYDLLAGKEKAGTDDRPGPGSSGNRECYFRRRFRYWSTTTAATMMTPLMISWM